jgi:hypothetical protein
MAITIVQMDPIRMETSSAWTALRKIKKCFSDKENVARPDAQGCRPDAGARKSIFYLI